jgi:hypothetical protein
VWTCVTCDYDLCRECKASGRRNLCERLIKQPNIAGGRYIHRLKRGEWNQFRYYKMTQVRPAKWEAELAGIEQSGTVEEKMWARFVRIDSDWELNFRRYREEETTELKHILQGLQQLSSPPREAVCRVNRLLLEAELDSIDQTDLDAMTAVAERMRKLVEEYNTLHDQKGDLTDAVATCKMNLGRHLLAAYRSNCHEKLREAERVLEEARDQFAELYRNTDDGYLKIFDAAVSLAQVRALLYNRQVDYREQLEMLAVAASADALSTADSDVMVKMKLILARSWYDNGQIEEARLMCDWIKRTYEQHPFCNSSFTVREGEMLKRRPTPTERLAELLAEIKEEATSEEEDEQEQQLQTQAVPHPPSGPPPSTAAAAAAAAAGSGEPAAKRQCHRSSMLKLCDGKYGCHLCECPRKRYLERLDRSKGLEEHYTTVHQRLPPKERRKGDANREASGHAPGCTIECRICKLTVRTRVAPTAMAVAVVPQ